MIVQNRLTPLGRDAATSALIAAYERLTGRSPSAKVLALLLTQSALETGHWKKIHNYNFGNVKAGAGYPLVVQFRCSEVDENGAETFYDPPDPHCSFRAYETAADGAVDYLKILQRRPHWWQGLHTEDPSAFVDALATPPKYFTANPEKYKGTVVALYERFLPLVRAALKSHQLSLGPAPSQPPQPPVPSALPPLPTPAPAVGPDSGSSCSAPSPPGSSLTLSTGPSAGVEPAPRADGTPGQARPSAARWLRVLELVLAWLARILGRRPS